MRSREYGKDRDYGQVAGMLCGIVHHFEAESKWEAMLGTGTSYLPARRPAEVRIIRKVLASSPLSSLAPSWSARNPLGHLVPTSRHTLGWQTR